MLKAVLVVAKAGVHSQEKLVEAIESRDLDGVRAVLKHRAEAAQRNIPGDYLPLLLAASLGYDEVVEELIRSGGADVHACNDVGDTALHIASRQGHTKVVRRLVAAGADLRARNKKLATPLLSAVAGRQHEVANILLEAGAEVEAKDGEGLTAVMHAARLGDLPMVTSLMAHGADVDARGPATMTSLLCAVDEGHADVAMALLKKCAADPTTDLIQRLLDREVTGSGHWAIARHLLTSRARSQQAAATDGGDVIFRLLYRAWEEGHAEFVRAVLGEAPPLSMVLPEQAMILAAGVGDARLVRELAGNRTAVNAADDLGRTALCLAALRGHVEVVEELILWGAEVNYRDRQDVTPLIWAVKGGHCRTARMLLSHGADVDYPSRTHGTALAVAVELNEPQLVELLLSHHADLRRAHRSGSLVSLATSGGCHTVLSLLLASGANPSDPDAFVIAVDQEDLVALRMLLANGADPNLVVSDDGETALLLACRLGRPLVATLLLQHKADPSIVDQHGSDCLVVAAVNHHIHVVTALLTNGAPMDSITQRLVADTLAQAGFGKMQIREALSSSMTRRSVDLSTKSRVDSVTAAYSLITIKPQTERRRSYLPQIGMRTVAPILPSPYASY